MSNLTQMIKRNKPIFELWYKNYSVSSISIILGIEQNYVKRKITARKVTDRATKEKVFEKYPNTFMDKLSEMWKEEENA